MCKHFLFQPKLAAHLILIHLFCIYIPLYRIGLSFIWTLEVHYLIVEIIQWKYQGIHNGL